jgi:phosphoesterase RecJ-like protein
MHSNSPLEAIASVIREKRRFLVLSHIRPDGDAIGCSLAMGLCLRELGKEVEIWNEDGLPQRFEFLENASLISKPPSAPQAFDVVLLLDTAVRNRAGARCLEKTAPGALWINIDHHISNDRLGDMVHVDTDAPAAGQILFELFTQTRLPLTKAMADALYTAISTDTGSFRYPNTTARTYEIAASLVRLGVSVGEMNQSLYENNSRRYLELLRSLLHVRRFTSEERVASFALSLKTARELGTVPDDTEGLIETIRSIEGVVVAAFFEELEDGLIRLSLRSKNPSVDVCQICKEFGGGGHTLASGARIAGTLAEVQEAVLAAVDRHLPALV